MTEKLKASDVESCVNVIASAFKNDPLFTYALSTDEEKELFSKHLRDYY